MQQHKQPPHTNTYRNNKSLSRERKRLTFFLSANMAECVALRCPTESHRQEWSLRLNSIQHWWCRVAVLSWQSHLSGWFRFSVYRERREKKREEERRRRGEIPPNSGLTYRHCFLFFYPPNSRLTNRQNRFFMLLIREIDTPFFHHPPNSWYLMTLLIKSYLTDIFA